MAHLYYDFLQIFAYLLMLLKASSGAALFTRKA